MQCGFIERSYILLVHFCEGTVLNTFLQLYQIAVQLFFHRALCGQKQSAGQIAFWGGEGEALLQLLTELRHKFGAYFPQRDRERRWPFVCVGDIEIVFQLFRTLCCVRKYRDAFGTSVHPATELPVPSLHFQHGDGVRALGIHKQLLVKRQPVVAAGCGQKCLPLRRVGHALLRLAIQFTQAFAEYCHPVCLLFNVDVHAPLRRGGK